MLQLVMVVVEIVSQQRGGSFVPNNFQPPNKVVTSPIHFLARLCYKLTISFQALSCINTSYFHALFCRLSKHLTERSLSPSLPISLPLSLSIHKYMQHFATTMEEDDDEEKEPDYFQYLNEVNLVSCFMICNIYYIKQDPN